ncbi:MAG: hypothetical protein KGN36_20360 [Acidobacteriota bacterium]|nr:hypothetical protein [Acidobacteriota bacterium]
MKFTPEDATARYRATLSKMQPDRMTEVGDNWDKAKLSFFFATDQNLAAFSARDTLTPMLKEDRRDLPKPAMSQFLASIGLDQQAGDVAGRIFDTYSSSTPIG